MRKFTVTEEHLALLRRANVGWEGSEFGAPAIDCKRPYGNSNVYGDMAEILGIGPDHEDPNGWYNLRDIERMRHLHLETQTVLQIALATGRFEAGDYVCDDGDLDWRKEVPS